MPLQAHEPGGFYVGLGGNEFAIRSAETDYAELLRHGFDTQSELTPSINRHFESGLRAGYQFNTFLRAELTYTNDFAHSSISSNSLHLGTDSESSVFNGAVTGTYALNRELGLFGSVGAAHWESGGTRTTDIGGTSVSFADRAGGADWVLGVGGQYSVSERALFEFEWKHRDAIGSSAGSANGHQLGGSVRYSF